MPPEGPVARITELDSPEGAALIAAMVGHLKSLYADFDRMPSLIHPKDFRHPVGAFVVVDLDGEPVACGGLRPCDAGAGIGELKRIWVEPHVRGRGLSRLLLDRLEREAAALGYSELYLDTGPRQLEAMRLYETSGYRSIPNYGRNAASTFVTSYAKRLV